jgi:hypothetical protein
MNAELVSELKAPRHRIWSARAISAIGPLTVLAATVWAVVQPYRLTLFHPEDQSFWWLVVEPPLLVLAVGLLFHFLIVPGVLEDMEDSNAASR